MAAGPTPFPQELDAENVLSCLSLVATTLQAKLVQDAKTDLLAETRALVDRTFAEQDLPNIMASTVLHGRDLCVPRTFGQDLPPLEQVAGKIVTSIPNYVEAQRSPTEIPWCGHAHALWGHDFLRIPTSQDTDCRRFVLFVHRKRLKSFQVTWGLLVGDGGRCERLRDAKDSHAQWTMDAGSAQLVEPGLVVKTGQPGHHVVLVTIRASSWKAPPEPVAEEAPAAPAAPAAAAPAPEPASLPVLAEAAAAATPSPELVERVEFLERENEGLQARIESLQGMLGEAQQRAEQASLGDLSAEHLSLTVLLANQSSAFLKEVEMFVRTKLGLQTLGAAAAPALPLPPSLAGAAGGLFGAGDLVGSPLGSPVRGGAAAAGSLVGSPARGVLGEGLAAGSLGKRRRLLAPIAVPLAPLAPLAAGAAGAAGAAAYEDGCQSPPASQILRRAPLPSSTSLPRGGVAVAAALPPDSGMRENDD